MNKLISLIAFSIILFAPAGIPQDAFAGGGGAGCGTITTIDNGIPSGTLGHFAVDVQKAGDTRCGIVTAEAEILGTITEDVVFDWFNYVETTSGVMRLADSTTSDPILVAGEVTSSGRFLGSNDNMIEWTAVSSIPAGATQMDSVYTFEDAPCGTFPLEEGPNCTTGVGFARLIQYLDEDVPPNVSNCVLTVRGSSAGGDLELFTIDTVELYGISQGGAFTPAQGLQNAVFEGWAASQYSDLVDELDGGFVRTVSLAGEIDPSLPFFVDPVLGDAFGPQDVTSMMVWLMDANTQVIIPTALGVVPSSTDIPSDGAIIGGEIIPIEATSLILAGAQSYSWMVAIAASILAIGLFVVSRKF